MNIGITTSLFVLTLLTGSVNADDELEFSARLTGDQ